MTWASAAGWVALGLFSVWAERRRNRRTDPDRVGWVPWPLVLIVALIGAALSVALALQLPG